MNDPPSPLPPKRIAELIKRSRIGRQACRRPDQPRRLEDHQPHASRIAVCLQGLFALPPQPEGDDVRFGPHTARSTGLSTGVGFWPGDGRPQLVRHHRPASGIMEAGHAGAGREHSMGLNILLPWEQTANPIILGDRKLVYMKYFFTRKLMFVKESDAFCLMPGGFGTLDEASRC